MTPDELLDIAIAVSEAARPVPLRYFRQPLEIIAKADDSPVTIADRETEAVMRALLAERVPGHGILGEEHGQERLDHRFVWVLDPIDGTRSFITGFPLFNNLIAVLDQGRPVVGVVDTPAIAERYHAARGRGDDKEADRLVSSAVEIIGTLAASIDDDEVRARYLAAPSVVRHGMKRSRSAVSEPMRAWIPSVVTSTALARNSDGICAL